MYPDFGNSIDSTACVVLGIHSSTGASESLQLVKPPVTILLPIDSYIRCDSYKEHYVLSWCPGSVLLRDKSNMSEVRPDMFRMQERAKCMETTTHP